MQRHLGQSLPPCGQQPQQLTCQALRRQLRFRDQHRCIGVDEKARVVRLMIVDRCSERHEHRGQSRGRNF